MNEAILLNKPAGMTSFSAVKKCAHILHEKKAGHTGTLDPQASGLMIVLLGSFTKLVPYALSNHKIYEAEFMLGRSTDTEDIWGNTVKETEWHMHDQKELDQISASFLGTIEQTPPMYSAVRVNGKRLYEYARKGETVERKARQVEISELKVQCLHDNVYSMHACVSSGTYIRTLIKDYAQKMNETGCMSALKRTAIEGLKLENAADFEQVEEGRGRISPLAVIDPKWKLVQIDPEAIADGRRIKADLADDKVIFTDGTVPLAAYEKREDGYYHCLRGLK